MIAVEQSAFSLYRHQRLFYVLGVYEPWKAVESGLKFRKRREIAWGARSGIGAGASVGFLEGEQATYGNLNGLAPD